MLGSGGLEAQGDVATSRIVKTPPSKDEKCAQDIVTRSGTKPMKRRARIQLLPQDVSSVGDGNSAEADKY